MSLDLMLLISHAGENDSGFAYAHTMLEVIVTESLSAQLFAIEKEAGRAAPRQFHTYTSRVGGEVHYGDTQRTPYGEKIVVVGPDALAPLRSHTDVASLGANRAVWAYLGELSPVTLVALYWR